MTSRWCGWTASIFPSYEHIRRRSSRRSPQEAQPVSRDEGDSFRLATDPIFCRSTTCPRRATHALRLPHAPQPGGAPTGYAPRSSRPRTVSRMRCARPRDRWVPVPTMAAFLQVRFRPASCRSTNPRTDTCLRRRGRGRTVVGTTMTWGPRDIFVVPPWHASRTTRRGRRPLRFRTGGAEGAGIWREEIGGGVAANDRAAELAMSTSAPAPATLDVWVIDNSGFARFTLPCSRCACSA